VNLILLDEFILKIIFDLAFFLWYNQKRNYNYFCIYECVRTSVYQFSTILDDLLVLTQTEENRE